MCVCVCVCFFFQAEDGIRDLVRSRGLGDVYKRQLSSFAPENMIPAFREMSFERLKYFVAPNPNPLSEKLLSLIHI